MSRLLFVSSMEEKNDVDIDTIVGKTKNSTQFLKIKWNRLQSLGIIDWWYVVLDLAKTNPEDGDIVLAYVDGESKPFLRVFKKDGAKTYLSVNEDPLFDIYPHETMFIQWTVVGFFSSLKRR